MSNFHLKDGTLSLKAKGLLSMFLSFPDDWNYSTRGLASICKEGVDAIGSTIKELEKAGYIVRHKLRGSNGRITDTEYVIYEQPQELPAPDADGPDAAQPDTEKPDTVDPDMAGPDMDAPHTENPAQLNIYQSITQKSNTHQYHAEKKDGVTTQHITIYYNCIGAFSVPGRRNIPNVEIKMGTRKGVAVSYSPEQIA